MRGVIRRIAGVYAALFVLLLISWVVCILAGFLNGGFLVFSSASLLFGLGCAYEYSQRDDVLEYLRGYHKTEAIAEEYYGYQLLFWKVKATIAAIFLVLAGYFLIRYGAHS